MFLHGESNLPRADTPQRGCLLCENATVRVGSSTATERLAADGQLETFGSGAEISPKQSPTGGRTMVGLSLVDVVIQ